MKITATHICLSILYFISDFVGDDVCCLHKNLVDSCGTNGCESRGSSVSMVSDYGLDDRGSISDRGKGFYL
jgi:hypothetical protein